MRPGHVSVPRSPLARTDHSREATYLAYKFLPRASVAEKLKLNKIETKLLNNCLFSKSIHTESGSSSQKEAAMAPILTMVSAIICLICIEWDKVDRRRLRVCEKNYLKIH